jgi:hypothetical protein
MAPGCSNKERWGRLGEVACMGEMRSSYISVGKPEGKRPLGRHRCKWEDNNYVELEEI